MADNILVTEGAGKSVRSTDKGGQQVEHVILDRGGTGAADAVDATHPLYVQPQPRSTQIAVASTGLTIATTAYTAGDQLGGEMTFAGAVAVSGGTGVIQSAVLLDKANILGAADLFLFDSASTPAGDNLANAWSDANMLKCQGIINFPTPTASANNRVAVVPYVGIGIKPAVTSLFGVLVTRAGHTFFGAVGDLNVILHILQD